MSKSALVGKQFEHLFAQQRFKGMPSIDLQAQAKAVAARTHQEPGPLMTGDPNQMAFPGMEHLAHAGAGLLARGYHFTAHEVPITHYVHDDPENPIVTPGNEILAHNRDLRQGFSEIDPRSEGHEHSAVGRITWHEGENPGDLPNAVEMIEVDHGLKGQGVGRTLGTIASTMTRPGSQPGMSKFRTREGHAWASKLAEKGVVKIPQ